MKTIDANKTADQLIVFIRDSFGKEGYDKAVIGVSGGIDSTTSAVLATRALGADHVYPVLLPYGNLNEEGEQDARLIVDWLKIPEKNVRLVDIKPMVDSAVATLDAHMDDGRKGNVMARTRMIVLYDFMKALVALVVGTENRTEHLLGYYTKFGDEASDIEPLRNLYKTQVYELARHLRVPRKFIEKAPTAGLWVGQTDEGEFGFSYAQVDEILSLHVDEGMSRKDLEARFDRALLDRMWWWIEKGSLKYRLPLFPQNPSK